MTSPLHPLVRDLDLFGGLAEPDIERILMHVRVRKVPQSATVFTQGAPAPHFFLLIEGQLKVVQTSPEGQQILAHWVVPGQLFGFVIALGRDDHAGTAIAVTESTLLIWPMEAWRSLASAYPCFAEAALRTLGGHLHDAFTRLREVSAADVQQRIARTLLRLACQSGRPTEQGVQIAFPITRQDIADMTCTTLHTASRTLSAWEHAGVLTGGRRRIIVRDPQELGRIADGR